MSMVVRKSCLNPGTRFNARGLNKLSGDMFVFLGTLDLSEGVQVNCNGTPQNRFFRIQKFSNSLGL
jgi:hypothetical protein